MDLKNGFLSLFFPTQCAGCGRYIKDFKYLYLCRACYAAIKKIPEESCPRCAKPFNSPHPAACRECAERKNHFSRVEPAGIYEGGLRNLIRGMKFYYKSSAARVLAGLIMERTDTGIFEGAHMLVPAPLGKKSERERGFNQTFAIARVVSSATGLPVVRALAKIRETAPQNSLDRKERMKNLSGAFKAVFDVGGKTVIIVDDVFTTGATINEAAKTLMEAGAAEVRGITAARSV
ncbi:MAG: ComF family protein [Candidatus Goldiibacteriota bacterium]|jgi:ComF family protein